MKCKFLFALNYAGHTHKKMTSKKEKQYSLSNIIINNNTNINTSIITHISSIITSINTNNNITNIIDIMVAVTHPENSGYVNWEASFFFFAVYKQKSNHRFLGLRFY